jgi:hypothetical protein
MSWHGRRMGLTGASIETRLADNLFSPFRNFSTSRTELLGQHRTTGEELLNLYGDRRIRFRVSVTGVLKQRRFWIFIHLFTESYEFLNVSLWRYPIGFLLVKTLTWLPHH